MEKYIVITGAGSGMGQATAILLSQDSNNRIICIGRQADKLAITKSSMNHPSNHFFWSMDMCNDADWKRHFQESHIPSLYAVFANAGIGGANAYGQDDRWEDIIHTNLTGTYVTINNCLPLLEKDTRSHRHVIITSSCLARFGVPGYSAYCTAKTGLLGLTRSMAVEHASKNILINAICPGWVETEMALTSVKRLSEFTGNSIERELEIQKSLVPLNRFSEPAEIAQFVAFLISENQKSITGQALDINNGSYMS
jgi:NAD(P)-dependent dehydrogenase (short-subunit alcohol dehydrogenase family)